MKIGLLLTILVLSTCYSITSQYATAPRNPLLESPSVDENVQRSPLREGSPDPKTNRVIVILAELADAANSTSVDMINSTVFKKMTSYYDEVSYLELVIAGNITSWIHLNNNTAYYGKDTGSGSSGIDDVDGDGVPDAWWLIRDVVSMTDNTIDFARYDTIIVVHSGRDQAQSGVPNDIWTSYYSGLSIPTNDGVTITSGIVVSEQDPMGIFAHEFGHSLGLPDLYNVNGGTEFVEDWDLMATGAWLGSPRGESPSHPTSWCKIQLGWIPADSLLIGRTIQGIIDRLETKGSNFTAIRIPVTTDTYYLVEVRQRFLYDSYLPQDGVLILYIDETLASGEGIVKVKYSQSLSAATYTASPGNNMYVDSGRNINITVLSAYSSSYGISVGLIRPDSTPPGIDLRNPVPWTWPTTLPARVGAIVTDIGTNSSSTKNATLLYSSDKGHSWNRIPMFPGSGDMYSAVIPPQNSSQVDYYIEAYDYAGNLAISNNSGRYYVYGAGEQGLVIAGIAIIIIGLICAAVATSSRRRRPGKVEVAEAPKLYG
jgi:M6 family metalloprotease-like protein